jgi:Lrp/AsnC family leucine-responsive transcriptional regulator
MAFDQFDREIVGCLAENARMSATELAGRVRLSVSATAERLRRLRASGVIQRFTIDIDPIAADRSIDAIIDVRLSADIDNEVVEFRLAAVSSVVDVVHLTGSFDLQIRVAARDVAELNDLLVLLKDELGTYETNTRLVLGVVPGFPRPIALG